MGSAAPVVDSPVLEAVAVEEPPVDEELPPQPATSRAKNAASVSSARERRIEKLLITASVSAGRTSGLSIDSSSTPQYLGCETGKLPLMGETRLAPEPDLMATKLGRERMVEAVRSLYSAVDILDPPRMEEHWIVIPADPSLVYIGLQRAVPDWFELFVVARQDGHRGEPPE